MKTVMFKMAQVLIVGVSFFLLLTTIACEKTEPVTEPMTDPKGALEAQADDYWKKRLLEKNFKATYDMETIKSTMPYEEYQEIVKNAGQMIYLNIRIEDVKVDGEKGTLRVKARWQMPAVPAPIQSSIRDEWVVRNNQWKHVLRIKNKKSNKK